MSETNKAVEAVARKWTIRATRQSDDYHGKPGFIIGGDPLGYGEQVRVIELTATVKAAIAAYEASRGEEARCEACGKTAREPVTDPESGIDLCPRCAVEGVAALGEEARQEDGREPEIRERLDEALNLIEHEAEQIDCKGSAESVVSAGRAVLAARSVIPEREAGTTPDEPKRVWLAPCPYCRDNHWRDYACSALRGAAEKADRWVRIAIDRNNDVGTLASRAVSAEALLARAREVIRRGEIRLDADCSPSSPLVREIDAFLTAPVQVEQRPVSSSPDEGDLRLCDTCGYMRESVADHDARMAAPPDESEWGKCVRCGREDTHGEFVELLTGMQTPDNPDGGTGDPICPDCIAAEEAKAASPDEGER